MVHVVRGYPDKGENGSLREGEGPLNFCVKSHDGCDIDSVRYEIF